MSEIYAWTTRTSWFDKIVDIVIAAWAATASSAADAQLIWWNIKWCYPSAWAADQVTKLVSVAADWVVTVDLAANTTAEVTMSVVITPITWNNA